MGTHRDVAGPAADAVGRPLIVLAAVALAIAVWHMLRFPVLVDDAFISFRVARNWALTGVPEYNPGVREWVPTSFLWVALLAGLGKLLPLTIPTLARVLGGVCGLATIVCLARCLPRLRGAGPLAALLCAASAQWAAWPLSGMETSAFSLGVLAACLATLRVLEDPTARRAAIAGAVCGVATLLRPDGALIAAVALAALILASRRARRAGWFLAAFAGTVLPMIAYLALVFGTELPVSYYAKVHGLENLDRGRAYLAGAFGAYHLAWLLPLAAAAAALRSSRRASLFLLAAIGAWCALVASEGGDFMPYYRFVDAIWPLLMLILALGLVEGGRLVAARRPAGRAPARAGVAAAALAAAALLALPTFRGADRRRYEASSADEQARAAIGRFLADKLPATDWIAVKPAGIIPYYSGLRAIDFFCIVDGEAARTGQWVPRAWAGHQRMNATRIHDVEPSVVILEARLGRLDSIPSPYATDSNHGRTWLEDPRSARYEATRCEVEPGRWLNLFLRKQATAEAPADRAQSPGVARSGGTSR